MAEGVIVFDDSPEILVSGSSSGRSFVIQDEGRDVLLLDREVTREIVESLPGETDFLVFDSPAIVAETLVAEPSFVLLDAPPTPTRVVMDSDTSQDLLILTAGGPPGPPGSPGPEGPQGPPGADGPGAYYQEFGFASPSNTWTVVHNQNSLALSVETVDVSGEPLEGYVRYVDLNIIEIDWYYPTAGTARVFR